MDEKDKRILATLGEILPKLSEIGQEKLISYGQGLEMAEAGQQSDEIINSRRAII